MADRCLFEVQVLGQDELGTVAREACDDARLGAGLQADYRTSAELLVGHALSGPYDDAFAIFVAWPSVDVVHEVAGLRPIDHAFAGVQAHFTRSPRPLAERTGPAGGRARRASTSITAAVAAAAVAAAAVAAAAVAAAAVRRLRAAVR